MQYFRKTSPRVRNGKVQPGYRHVLLKRHIEDFIRILPEWDELSKGLNAIVLDEGDPGCDGWHRPGVVAVCAWERDLWRTVEAWYYHEHKDIFERLDVSAEERGTRFLCRFDEASVRAYQLLHILLHELGHHHDRMTTRSQRQACRGERYAESYARGHERLIWERYFRTCVEA